MKLIILTILSILALTHAQQANCNLPECLYHPKIGESLPVTEEEIQDECKDLRKFQDCFQEWSTNCLTPEILPTYNAKVEKPLKFIKALCGNQKFRRDYLAEKDSFMKLSSKWTNCLNVFQKTQAESADMNNHTMPDTVDMCCGLQNFNECTEKLCDTDCSGPAKDMLDRIIEMFKSGYDVVNCKNIELSMCPSTSGSARTLYSFVWTLVPIVVLLVLYR